MNSAPLIVLVGATYLAVFLAGSLDSIRNWLGVQIDPLPALMVYCGLSARLSALSLTALLGGLWFDSLSGNPLGTSILPLFLAGAFIHWNRELILRDQAYARFVLGVMASGFVPLLTLAILFLSGNAPPVGLGSAWQWLCLSVSGGVLTLGWFWVLERIQGAVHYRPSPEPAFRTDREIKRGRA